MEVNSRTKESFDSFQILPSFPHPSSQAHVRRVTSIEISFCSKCSASQPGLSLLKSPFTYKFLVPRSPAGSP